MVCTFLRFLLFPLAGSQSVSSEGRGGGRAVDYAVGMAIHQRCRRVVRLMIWSLAARARTQTHRHSHTGTQLMSAVSQQRCRNIIPPPLQGISHLCWVSAYWPCVHSCSCIYRWRPDKTLRGTRGACRSSAQRKSTAALASVLRASDCSPRVRFFFLLLLYILLWIQGSHMTLRHLSSDEPVWGRSGKAGQTSVRRWAPSCEGPFEGRCRRRTTVRSAQTTVIR